jgi:hypothetical protein
MSNRLTRSLKHVLLRAYLPKGDRAMWFLLDEPWTPGFWREVRRASTYRAAIDFGAVRPVHFFSYSRSGTHNIMARLHYLPASFVFHENIFVSASDRSQIGVRPEHVGTRHYLAFSMFGPAGLQDKRGGDLRRLFFWNNRYLELDEPLRIDGAVAGGGHVVFHMRNFFRTLYSRHKSGVTMNKPHFVLDDAAIDAAFVRHRAKMVEVCAMLDRFPSSVTVTVHEVFCSRPRQVLDELCDRLGVPAGSDGRWPAPRSFFRRCFGSCGDPVERGGRLWCDERGVAIEGVGGAFNPLPEPDLRRTLSDPIGELITPARLARAEKVFGQELARFWLNDASFDYGCASQAACLDMIRRAVRA